jgi:cytochrome c553
MSERNGSKFPEYFLDGLEDFGRAAPAGWAIVQRTRVLMGVSTILTVVLMAAGAGRALAEQENPSPTDVPAGPVWEYDPENAQEILETCAGCHGKNGQGGSDGTYPRLAGLRAKYIAKQLRAFKTKERINIPMYPYAIERDLPETDVLDIARLLSKIELPTELPEFDESTSAFEKLRAAQSVFNVRRVDGDVERGAELYEEKCRKCHGKEARGRGSSPQLAGQYTEYVERQIEQYKTGERAYQEKRMKKVIDTLRDEDIQDLLAYFSTRDD